MQLKFRMGCFILAMFIWIIPSTAFSQYTCVEGDCENGTGKRVAQDGKASMEGKFFNGQLIEGIAKLPNGDVYEGLFQGNYLIRGTKKFHNGAVFRGEFTSTVLTKGTILYPDGRKVNINLKPKTNFQGAR